MRKLFLLTVFTIVTAFAADASEFENKVAELGGVVNDLSASTKISLDEPRCAYVNFSGFDDMPPAKKVDYKGWIEFFDGEGNYFKKRVIANAQGNSSLGFPKKNVSVDIVDDEWVGDETPDIAFGDWVKQDGFHLKSYYIDYFRGVAVAAYHVYDMTIADHGDMRHPWQRAGVADANDKARCHPDGFPCAVYLNGKFYGVFSWQLKKHRKNMGMTKDLAEHIHLDGDINTVTLFKENGIDWTAFEVRNPKTLYCMDGSKYDGDAPRELIDETSSAYDATKPGHVLSAKVKEYIKTLGRSCYVLDRLRRSGLNSDQMREEIEKRFDTQGMVDYVVFSSVVNNVDGWWKNWQWITYDGKKWFVEPYDLDMTFGGLSSGYYVTAPEFNWYYEDPLKRFYLPIGPFAYIYDYYTTDIEERYRTLRDNGVYTHENILGLVQDWYDRVGEENYAKDNARWRDSYFLRDMVVNPNWEALELWWGYQGIPDYDARRTYREGSLVKQYWRVFRAKNEVRGQAPVRQMGYRDGIDRISGWISRRLELQDSLLLGIDPPSGVEGLRPDTAEAAGKEMIFDLQGRRLKELQRGLNIVGGRVVVRN